MTYAHEEEETSPHTPKPNPPTPGCLSVNYLVQEVRAGGIEATKTTFQTPGDVGENWGRDRAARDPQVWLPS